MVVTEELYSTSVMFLVIETFSSFFFFFVINTGFHASLHAPRLIPRILKLTIM